MSEAPAGDALRRPSHAQRPLWVGQQLDRDSPLYNMAFLFLLPRGLDRERFRRAWAQVARDVELLRTRFVERGGEPFVHAVDEGPALELEGEDRTLEAARRWAETRAAIPLELEGALVDTRLLPLEDGRSAWYLNQHHLVTDAASTRLLFERVVAAYEDPDAAEADPAPDYLEAAASEVASAAADAARCEAAAAHVRARRASARGLALYGEPHDPSQGTASRRTTLQLDPARVTALDALCRQPGFASLSRDLARFSVFATLLTAWLHRVTGADEVGFDAPVAGRASDRAKRTPGPFLELFPFAARVAPGESFRALGARSLQESQDLLRHGLPGLSGASGAGGGNVVLNFVPGAFASLAGEPVPVEWIHPGHVDKGHDLRLQVHDLSGSGGITLHFDLRADLPDALHARAPRHFEALFDALLADPDRAIDTVELCTPDELEELAARNGSTAPALPARTVIDALREQAQAAPERIAVREGERSLGFAELWARVEALGSRLVEAGVQPGDRVALEARRRIEVVVGLLAVLRVGAAYVAIDPAYPERRRRFLLEDAGARLVLVQGGSALAGGDVPTLELDLERPAQPLSLERPLPAAGDLAYVLYTSGSTGTPKGVLVEHAGLAEYVAWAERHYVRGERLTYGLFTSLAFDLTVTCLFLPLVTGGTLVVYPEPEAEGDGGRTLDTALFDVLREDAVEFLKLTPAHLGLASQAELRSTRLRRLLVGGEALRTSLAATALEQLGGSGALELYNEYGPTEAVVGCVVHRFDPETDRGLDVPIGRPADHARVAVRTGGGALAPLGAPGELWVARPGLARGYHGDPKRTAARFEPLPDGGGLRRYRTGDRVRWTRAGVLDYLGRTDRQLKVSGFRVEPGEVEAALLDVPGVEACAVVPRRREVEKVAAGGALRHCVRCGLASSYPEATFDDEDVCSICRSYEAIREHAADYFRTEEDLRALFDASRARQEARGAAGGYDCMMLLSGGKDSTYALCRLVEMGLRVYTFTLDNGYIAEGAKTNIRRVADTLGVPIEFAETPAMPAIFRDSLLRFSNVCQGCFKTIYTLATLRARELGIPVVVTGLSRGQMFETRLTEEMFRDGRRTAEEVDAAVLAARKVYHRLDDEVGRSLDVSVFQEDGVFDEVQFVDFYRYVDVGLSELYAYLGTKVPWARPEDTGRSTNCLINDVGIFVHRRERGFHNYALPYSWDVRLGHKTRAEAIDELNDAIDHDFVRQTLEEIGYDQDHLAGAERQPVLAAYFVANAPLSNETLRQALSERLPAHLVPAYLAQVDAIPLTAHGKVDESALPWIEHERGSVPYRAPEGPVEEFLVEAWSRHLHVDDLGTDEDFFSLGGTSLAAMEVMIELCREFTLDLELATLFEHPTIRRLARVAEERILGEVDGAKH